MRNLKLLTALLTAATLLLVAGVALASKPAYRALTNTEMTSGPWQPATYSQINGKVTAITTQSPTTLTIRGMQNQQPRTVQVQVTDQTGIREGIFRERLADVKVGTHVRVGYERTKGKLIADGIQILDPAVALRGTEGPDVR